MTLTKKPRLIYRPAVAGSPGDPGAPATPGYYADAPGAGPVIRWVLTGGGRVLAVSYAVEQPPPVAPVIVDGVTPTLPVWVAAPAPSTAGVWVPPSPGRPPTPPVQGTSAQTETTFNLGWNSGAISTTTRDGDLVLALQASSSSVGIVVGLSNQYTGNDYKKIGHGFYFAGGKAIVYENGVQKTAAASFANADEFQIRRTSGVVSYYRGATLLYTSAVSSSGPVFADSSLYAAGDAITAAAFTAGVASSPAITQDAKSAASLRPLIGQSFDNAVGYAESRAYLLPLKSASADSDQELHPDYTLTSASFLPLQGFGVMISGKVAESAASFLPVIALSSDADYTESRGSFRPMRSLAVQIPPLGNYAFITAPMGTLYATAHDSTGENAANITAPMGVLQAFMGSAANITAPIPTVSASATGTNWLSAAITAPIGMLNATGTASGTSQANITAPMATLIGYGGMVCSVTLTGMPTLQAHVTSGGIVSAAITGPMAKLTLFEVSTQAHCSANLLAPMGRMGNSLQAWIMAPMATLTAIGSAVVAVTYEAYSINLSHTPKRGEEPVDEVTRYTNFPFSHVVRYQNSYFGVAADGLYLLEGTTDDGAVIPYAVKTCIDDFKTPELKTVAAAYFGGRIGPDMTVTLRAGETGAESYDYNTVRGQGAQNHREKFGRGVKNRYFAIGVAGEGALELDNIELEINKLPRRI